MKKGFTMIELIFVIVILGILAAVAVPKLTATRDDAEVSKAAANVATAISDITSYYTAKGSFDGTISNMTNVKLSDVSGKTGYVPVKNEKCIKLEATTDALKVSKEAGTNNGTICDKVAGHPGVASAITQSGANGIKIGGSGVSF